MSRNIIFSLRKVFVKYLISLMHTESFDQSRQQSRLVSSASKALSNLLLGSLVTSLAARLCMP